jgi:hypothetical protein
LKASPSLFTHTLPRARSIRQHEYVFLKAGLKFSKKAFQQRWKLSVNKEFIQVKIPIILDFAIHFFLLIKTACWLPEVVSREDRETLTRVSGGRMWLQKKIGSFSQGSIPVIFISCTGQTSRHWSQEYNSFKISDAVAKVPWFYGMCDKSEHAVRNFYRA